MFPLNWNIPFIRKNGSRTTLGAITGDIAGIEEDVEDLTAQTSALWDNVEQNGAKNLFPLVFSDIKAWNTGGTWDGNAYTFRGVTYTCIVNNGYITRIDLTGTCEDNASIFDLYGTNISGYWLTNKYKGMLLSGGKSADIFLQARGANNDSGSGRVDYDDTGNGVIIGDKSNLRILILVSVGTSTGVSIEPMIRLASDTDPTYQPYAMTNRELTENVTPEEVAYTINSSIINAGPRLKLYKIGKEIVPTGYFSTSAAAAQYDTLFTITNEKSKDEYEYFILVNSSGDVFLSRFNSDGTVKLDSATMPAGGYIVFGSLIIQ